MHFPTIGGCVPVIGLFAMFLGANESTSFVWVVRSTETVVGTSSGSATGTGITICRAAIGWTRVPIAIGAIVGVVGRSLSRTTAVPIASSLTILSLLLEIFFSVARNASIVVRIRTILEVMVLVAVETHNGCGVHCLLRRRWLSLDELGPLTVLGIAVVELIRHVTDELNRGEIVQVSGIWSSLSSLFGDAAIGFFLSTSASNLLKLSVEGLDARRLVDADDGVNISRRERSTSRVRDTTSDRNDDCGDRLDVFASHFVHTIGLELVVHSSDCLFGGKE